MKSLIVIACCLTACSFEQRLRTMPSPQEPALPAPNDPSSPSGQTGPTSLPRLGELSETPGNAPLLRVSCKTTSEYVRECTCPAGYTADGSVCVLAEFAPLQASGCTSGAFGRVCGFYSTCTNMPNGFSCECIPGARVVDGQCVDESGDVHCAIDGDSVTCTCNNRLVASPSHSWCKLPAEVGSPCADNPCGPGACAEVEGGYACTCEPDTVPRLAQSGQDYCVSTCGQGQHVTAVGACGALSESMPLHIGSDVWTSVQSAWERTCGVKQDGTLWCWGKLEIGDTAEHSYLPLQLGTDSDWLEVAEIRSDIMCARKGDQTLWCWGANPERYGQIPGATGPVVALPWQVATDAWLGASMSFGHTCAVRDDHSLHCWGVHPFGIPETPVFTVGAIYQVEPNTSDWASVSVGWRTACGIRDDGAGSRTLWCWGDNVFGQLGVGVSGGMSQLPMQVGTETDWELVQAATDLTCGVRTDSGAHTAWCWGRNTLPWRGDAGLLGGGASAPDSNVPVLVSDSWVALSTSTGVGSVCGIRDVSGEHGLWCWPSPDGDRLPVRVGTAGDWASISVGIDHQCGLRADGSLWCWGQGKDGQLGDGRQP